MKHFQTICWAFVVGVFLWSGPVAGRINLDGNDAFKAKVNACLEQYRNMGGDFTSVVDGLKNSGRTHVIQDTGTDGSKTMKNQSSPDSDNDAQSMAAGGTGRGSGSKIGVDPNYTGNLSGGVAAQFCATLLHEMSHSLETDQGKLDRREDATTHIRHTETNATTLENNFRANQGLPQRPQYGRNNLPASAFTYPKAALEAERDRIVGLINGSNAALAKLEASKTQAAEQATKAKQFLQQLKDLKVNVTAAGERTEQAKQLMAPIEQAVAAVRQGIQQLEPFNDPVLDAASQVCQLMEYYGKEPKDPQMLTAAKFQLQQAEAAFTQLKQQSGEVAKALQAASQQANAADQQLQTLFKGVSDEDKKALAAVTKLKADLKTAASAAQTAATKAKEQEAGVLTPVGEAKTAAAAFTARVDALTGTFASDGVKVAELGAMKTALATALTTLKDAQVPTTVAEAATAAEDAQKAATEGASLHSDLEQAAQGPKPKELVKAVTEEMAASTRKVAATEKELIKARNCLKNGVGKVSLGGTVTDKKTGKPIGGATVNVTGGVSSSTTTSAAGGFSVGGVELNMQLRVTASAAGYQGHFKELKVTSENPHVGIALEPKCATGDAGSSNLDEGCAPAALSGTVVDKDTGRPIAGASVEVGGQALTTSASGGFKAEGLMLNEVLTVSASAKGYATLSRPVKLGEPETAISLGLSPRIDAMIIAFRPPDPGSSQAVFVTVSVVPRRANVLIRARVFGTDRYFAEHVLSTNANGEISFVVPGGAQGVKDMIIAHLVGYDLEVTDGYVF